MAKKDVPQKAGDAMANLVCRCLNFWDTDGDNVAKAFDAEIFDKFNKILAVI
jgi:hypothetical protein